MFLFFGEPHGVFVRIFKVASRYPQGDRKSTAGGPYGELAARWAVTSGFFFIFLFFFTSSFVSAYRIAMASVEMKKVRTPQL